MLDFFYHDDACHVKPQHWDKNNDVIKPWLTYNIIATYAHLEKLRHRNQSHLAITMEPIAYPNKQYLFLSLYLCIYIYIYQESIYIRIHIICIIYTWLSFLNCIYSIYSIHIFTSPTPAEALEAAESGQQKAAALNSRAQLWKPSGTNGTATLELVVKLVTLSPHTLRVIWFFVFVCII